MIPKLRERITIEKPVHTPDGSGGQTTIYIQHAGPVWAQIKPSGGKERFFAQKREMNITHKITIRYWSDVKILLAEMRVIHKSRIFKIIHIINRDERERWIDLLCEEGSGN